MKWIDFKIQIAPCRIQITRLALRFWKLKDKIQIPNSETAVSVYAPALSPHQTRPLFRGRLNSLCELTRPKEAPQRRRASSSRLVFLKSSASLCSLWTQPAVCFVARFQSCVRAPPGCRRCTVYHPRCCSIRRPGRCARPRAVWQWARMALLRHATAKLTALPTLRAEVAVAVAVAAIAAAGQLGSIRSPRPRVTRSRSTAPT